MKPLDSDPDEADRLDWPNIDRVLLVRLRSIGDTVLMTPCLAALKQLRPSIETWIVSEPLAAPLLDEHPLVDRLLVSEPTFKSRAQTVLALRKARIDAAFNMHGGSTAAFLTAFSGARRTVGYGDYSFSRLLNHRAPSPDRILGRSLIHSVEQQFALMVWAGLPGFDAPPKLNLAVSSEARTSLEERLTDIGLAASETALAVIAPGAALESKRWPARLFADVADHLSQYWRLPVVVVSTREQETVSREVVAAGTSKPGLLIGLSLKELTALLARASLFVGNDSGPMHIAAAFERPIVAIFGSSDARVWHPWTKSPFRAINGDPEIKMAVENVAVRDVLAAVDEVIEAAVL